MKNMKKMLDEADDSVLDDLISQCEAKMSSKFKPKEEKKPEPKEESSSDDEEGDLDDEKMARLIEAYRNSK